MSVSAAIRASMRGNEPTPEQWRAITGPPEPQAIIAGAGSGKTAIMAARMVWMVEQGLVRPAQVLGLTFTNKASSELEERIDSAFDHLDPPPEDRPAVFTYNAFADRVVREHGLRIGFDPESTLLSQAQTWQLLAEALDHVDPFEAIDSRSMASITRSALSLADQCANNFVSPDEVAEEDRRVLEREAAYEKDMLICSRRRIELCAVVRVYQQLKKTRRCMDYGDQVTKAVEVLETWPSVAVELRGRYPAILLDEYQDTNVAQRRLLQALAPEGSNVTAVGDARQNIFQWRGSTLFNLIDFPDKHFLRAGGRRHDYLSLADNFRSGSRIVEVANSIIDVVPGDRRPGRAQSAVEANLEGFVGTKLLEDQRREAQFIAGEIQRWHGEPAAPGRPPVRWRDCAVLVRRKSHLSTIYSVLREADVPVEVVGLGGLLQVPEVMDTVAWLRLVADPGPGSNRWLARILFGPRFRVHYRDLAVLARWAAARTRELSESKRDLTAVDDPAVPDETAFEPDEIAFSLVEALDHLEEISNLAPDARVRLERVRVELAHLRSRAGLPLLDLVQAILSTCDITEALQASPRQDAGASLGNLRQFMNLVAGFAPVSGVPSLGEFLEYLDAAEDADDPMGLEVTSGEDSVKLMTIHSAKGLEFEMVFVPGVAAGENAEGKKVYSIFPDERSSNPMISFNQLPYGVREDRHHLPDPMTVDRRGNPTLKKRRVFSDELRARAVEDERRLFYVALTRARQRLYVTASWWYERQRRPHGPSVFFEEVAAHPQVENLGAAEQPALSPLMEELAARAVWPPKLAGGAGVSPQFPDGPVADLGGLLSGELAPDELLARLDTEQRAAAQHLLAEHRKVADALGSGAGEEPTRVKVGGSLTAGQAVLIASGAAPVSGLARPLPQPPSGRALIGTEIHRWIEEQARGLTGLVDEESLDERLSGADQQELERLKRTYGEMGYADRTLARLPGGEPMAELRFVLKVGDRLVRGRMDAVYETDAGLEIVDFKSGAVLDKPELDQLVIYGAALRKMGVTADRELQLTYCYLAAGEVSTRVISAAEVDEALDRLVTALGAG